MEGMYVGRFVGLVEGRWVGMEVIGLGEGFLVGVVEGRLEG